MDEGSNRRCLVRHVYYFPSRKDCPTHRWRVGIGIPMRVSKIRDCWSRFHYIQFFQHLLMSCQVSTGLFAIYILHSWNQGLRRLILKLQFRLSSMKRKSKASFQNSKHDQEQTSAHRSSAPVYDHCYISCLLDHFLAIQFYSFCHYLNLSHQRLKVPQFTPTVQNLFDFVQIEFKHKWLKI